MGTDIHGVFQRQTADGWEDVPSKFEENRHYQLFAVLAGVRNGYGFAGAPTGEVVKPISEPRGLPPDFPCEDDEHPAPSGESLWMGDHSHSWLTAHEMLEWAEHAPVVTKTGVVSRETFATWDRKSRPAEYCAAVSGRGASTVEWHGGEPPAGRWAHIRVTWLSPLSEELSYFFDEVRRLQALHGQVRFVFGFDS